MTAWIDQPSIVPFVQFLGETEGREFRDVVVERMTAECRRDDGTWFESFRRVNLFAWKQGS